MCRLIILSFGNALISSNHKLSPGQSVTYYHPGPLFEQEDRISEITQNQLEDFFPDIISLGQESDKIHTIE
jgi:hypothetical protein